ncbi:hypothetical protein AM501_00160 [Aneurinibacillus migulanus]|nr:hypothetical protein TS64_22245 [Aneurinibacillus migulanus]KPD10190.1 hypothetical protein AM501_00160 [Aneurinibacillus migulanus]
MALYLGVAYERAGVPNRGGKRIGEEIGEKKAIMKVALSMIQKGIDNETIVELTELTQEEIEQLRRQ